MMDKEKNVNLVSVGETTEGQEKRACCFYELLQLYFKNHDQSKVFTWVFQLYLNELYETIMYSGDVHKCGGSIRSPDGLVGGIHG